MKVDKKVEIFINRNFIEITSITHTLKFVNFDYTKTKSSKLS